MMSFTKSRRMNARDRWFRARLARARRARRGFTLLETALATVIVGVGVLAIVAAQQAFHQQNRWSTHASTAKHLGNEIREMTLNLTRHDPVTGVAFWGPEPNEAWLGDFDDVDDFDGDGGGLVFSQDWNPATLDNGPINARRDVIQDMRGWSQTVTVTNVDRFDISSAVAQADGSTDMVMVEVVVEFQGVNDVEPTEMTRVAWISPR